MKLRMTGLPGPGHAFCGSMDDLEHDAMAAHALLQALRNEAPGVHGRVTERAAEILAGWLGEERG